MMESLSQMERVPEVTELSRAPSIKRSSALTAHDTEHKVVRSALRTRQYFTPNTVTACMVYSYILHVLQCPQRTSSTCIVNV